ncbi:hypothetical protein BDR22DRAFT_99995 [Usnea florida]
MTRRATAGRAIGSRPLHLPVNSEASSRRKPGRPANRSEPIRSRTTNLGITILDDDSVSAKGNISRHPPQVLKEVAIPLGGRSSISSSLSSVRDESSEYDTPGTSTVVTPAESLMKEGRSMKRPSRISSSNLTCHSEESFKGKRKRMVVDELLEADAILARELQEQEYGKDEQAAAKPMSVRKELIEDSEESLLSDSRGENSLEVGDSAVFDLSLPKRSNRGRRKAWLSQVPPTDVKGEQSQEESSIEEEISESLMPKVKRSVTVRTPNCLIKATTRLFSSPIVNRMRLKTLKILMKRLRMSLVHQTAIRQLSWQAAPPQCQRPSLLLVVEAPVVEELRHPKLSIALEADALGRDVLKTGHPFDQACASYATRYDHSQA